MIAALGMYDRPETAGANDRLWAGIRDRLRSAGLAAPDSLTRGEGAYWPAWQSPDLLLAQTCGFPFRARLHGHVTLVGTPDYGLPDCPPGYYSSVLIARADDPRLLPDLAAARFAFNDGLSQSGWAAPQNHVAAMGLRFRPTVETGAHRASAAAVAEGRADIAAVDAVTWALMRRWDPVVAGLREVARTAPTPGLPLITAAGRDPAPLAAAVAGAIGDLSSDDRDTLHLRGLAHIPAARYLAVPTPPPPDRIDQPD